MRKYSFEHYKLLRNDFHLDNKNVRQDIKWVPSTRKFPFRRKITKIVN